MHLTAFIERSDSSEASEKKDTYPDHSNSYDPQFEQYGVSDPSQPSRAEERKLLAKIDFRLMPVLSMLYLLAFLGW